MKFLADEMLRGLARWLRVAGYDTAVAEPGTSDRELLAQARREGRIFLTRDRRLVETLPPADDVVLLECHDLDDCLAELGRRLRIDWQHRPFSRCLGCNTPLQPADAARWEDVPDGARAGATELRHCPACRQLYWDGSHVARMRERLAELAGQADD